MASARGLPFTAAQRVIDRVHGHAADVRTTSQPAAAARLADRDVLVIEIADLADRRDALEIDATHFTRRQLHRGVLAFLGDELHRRSRRARDLTALARLQLDVVDLRAEWNRLQRQAVAGQGVAVVARHD